MIVLRFAREGADVAIDDSRDDGAERACCFWHKVEASGYAGIPIKANPAQRSETLQRWSMRLRRDSIGLDISVNCRH